MNRFSCALIAAVMHFALSVNPASAICLREGCQALEIRIEQCEEAKFSNREAITDFIQRGGAGPGEQQGWLSKIVEFQGLKISGTVAAASAVECSAGNKQSLQWPARYSSGDPDTFFLLAPGERCELLDESMYATYFPRCCDTLPPEGKCVIRLPLLEPTTRMPPSGGSEVPGDMGSTDSSYSDSGHFDSMLSERPALFDRE